MTVFVPRLKQRIETDVLVCGLGPAGVSAAVAAARHGAKTFAVETCAYAGGNITNANVIGVCGALNQKTGRLIVGGITRELLQRSALLRDPVDWDKQTPLSKLNLDGTRLYEPMSDERATTHPNGVSIIYDAEWYKHQADGMLKESGARFLYHTRVCDVVMEGDRIGAVIVANKWGLSEIRLRMVLDTTGDGDVAAWSGAPFEMLLDTMQAGTSIFVMGGVKYDDYAQLKVRCIECFAKANARGEMRRYFGPGVGRLHKGVINFNMTRIKYNSTDPEQVTAAEVQVRDDIALYSSILIRDMPEFKDAYLLYSGPHIGPRESRRIQGEYVLTYDDVLKTRRFDDTVGLGGHPIDYHDPNVVGGFNSTRQVDPYPIPYRTLVPQKVENLLVAGRCHSADQMAASSTRVALTAAVLGEAAGKAAGMALDAGITPREVDGVKLREALVLQGAVVE